MASVERIPAVTKVVETVVEDEKFVLSLSADEAAALRALTGSVRFDGPLQGLYDALRLSGVDDNKYYVPECPTIRIVRNP